MIYDGNHLSGFQEEMPNFIDVRFPFSEYPNDVRKVSYVSIQSKATAKQISYGRPRLLTHDEILDAAIEMGLETLTMKKLASELGVGTATLYQYFDSRRDLTRAAAVHALSDVPLPKDKGQPWPELARDYVSLIQALLADNPTFLQSYQPTTLGRPAMFLQRQPARQGMGRFVGFFD